VRILSFSAPLGGGLVSLKTHFETHNSYFLSVIVPAPLSAAIDAVLKERRHPDKAMDTAANRLRDPSLSIEGAFPKLITLLSSTPDPRSFIIFKRDLDDCTADKPKRLWPAVLLPIEKALQESRQQPNTATATMKELKNFI
jgi:hypothetical protein